MCRSTHKPLDLPTDPGLGGFGSADKKIFIIMGLDGEAMTDSVNCNDFTIEYQEDILWGDRCNTNPTVKGWGVSHDGLDGCRY